MVARKSPNCSKGPPALAMTASSAATSTQESIWAGCTSAFTSKASSGPAITT